MDGQEQHPELAGYDPADDRPLGGRRRMVVIRSVVVLGVIALVLPGIVTTVSVSSATAESACATWVHYAAPDASGSSARFEIFGAGGIGWECYTVGAFGGDRHVASLGLIPENARLPVPTLGS